MTGISYTSDLKRTVKGSEEVTRKTHKLSSRQRQFLLLIDKSDALNQQICENLSQSIDVEQLIDLGLLSTAEKVQSTQESPVSKALASEELASEELASEEMVEEISEKVVAENQIEETIEAVEDIVEHTHSDSIDNSIIVDAVPLSSNNISLADLPRVETTELSLAEFSEIKEIMWSSLKKTSGLLAADLMMRIEKSAQPQQLKRLTARWRTTMLESRYDRVQIQAWFDEVNSRLNA